MSTLYAMRRANGDWFALDEPGRLRVPVFHRHRDGIQARLQYAGMTLFVPVALDGSALDDLRPGKGESEVSFWLVESPFAQMNRGRLLDHAQLSHLVHEGPGR